MRLPRISAPNKPQQTPLNLLTKLAFIRGSDKSPKDVRGMALSKCPKSLPVIRYADNFNLTDKGPTVLTALIVSAFISRSFLLFSRHLEQNILFTVQFFIFSCIVFQYVYCCNCCTGRAEHLDTSCADNCRRWLFKVQRYRTTEWDHSMDRH